MGVCDNEIHDALVCWCVKLDKMYRMVEDQAYDRLEGEIKVNGDDIRIEMIV